LLHRHPVCNRRDEGILHVPWAHLREVH